MTDISKAEKLARAVDNVRSGGRSFDRQLAAQISKELRAQAARIAELEAERDADMRDLIKVEVITRIQQQAREDALREAEQVCDNERMEAVKYKLPHIALGALWCRRKITALINKEPKP